MSQTIDKKLLNDFETSQKKAMRELQSRIKNSGAAPPGSWTEAIVSKIRISDLASEFGINECPVCNYRLIFDDNRGWFICVKAKYEKTCDFRGNIVDFMERCG